MRFVTLVFACLILAACSGERAAPPAPGGTIVTVFGAVTETDRGPVRPGMEPYFASLGIQFETARGLTREDLLALPQRTVVTDYPEDGGSRVFTGPLVRDVLALAGPADPEQAGHARFVALDGYERLIARHRFDEYDAILALTLEGEPLGLGGFGPAMLVWPRRDNPALIGMPDDDWVWGVVAVEVMARP